MLRRLVLLLLCLINRPTRVLSTLQRGGGENRTLVEMNCEPEFFGGWGNVPGLSELEGCDGHADATSSHGWEEADVFGEPMCFIGGWDAVPVEPVPRGPVAHGGRPEKRRADRKAASNKQPRRLGAVAAEHGALGMIRQAGGGMVNCSKSCTDQKCAQRIVNSVPALELLQKQTWRHKSAIGEKHVAAAFVKEIRAAALPDTHPVRYALNVGNCSCCEYAHAYFNGCWEEGDAGKGRPNRTYRRYMHTAINGSASDVAGERGSTGDAEKRMHASCWIQDRIVNFLGQTHSIMSGGGSGSLNIAQNGEVTSSEWTYKIRPVIIAHEHKQYRSESEANGSRFAAVDLFREMWAHVTSEVLNVTIDSKSRTAPRPATAHAN